METMSSLHHHLFAKPKERSLYGATGRDISVKMNCTRRVRLPARVPSSSWAVKCSAAFRPEDPDDKEGQSKFKSFGINTDFGTSLLMTYFPLSAALGDVLGPAEKIEHVLSSYEDKLEKLKVIQRTVGVQIGDGGEHDYLVKLDRVEQLIYQGQFEFAKQYCENHILPEAPPQDYRPRFYLVVAQVMLMLDLVDKTGEYWKEVVDSYRMFRVPISEPHDQDDVGGPMPSPVEGGEDQQLEIFLELMKIFKQAISGTPSRNSSTGYLDNLSPPSHKA